MSLYTAAQQQHSSRSEFEVSLGPPIRFAKILQMSSIGILLSATASCMNALGLNLQRMAGGPTLLVQKTQYNARCWTQNKIRASSNILASFGIILSTSCGIVDAMSYGYAPQSMLAPIGAVTLVVNLLLAPVLHGEAIKASDLFFTTVIVVGVIICIMGGTRGESGDTYTPSELYKLSENPTFRQLVVMVLGIVVVLATHLWKSEREGRSDKLSTGFVYPVIAGILGGSTVLTAKILTTILSSSDEVDVTGTVIPLALLVGSFAISQILMNQRGLEKHSALIMVPIYSSTFVLSNAVGGGIFFQEFARVDTQGVRMYVGGVMLVLFGVLTMAITKQKELRNLAATKSKKKQKNIKKNTKQKEETKKVGKKRSKSIRRKKRVK